MRYTILKVLTGLGLGLMTVNTAAAQAVPTYCTTAPANLTDEAKANLQAQCAQILQELAKAAYQKAKVDAKTAGLNTTIPNAPTGAITSTAANDKYPTVLAAAALSYAGNVVGRRICHQARMARAPGLVVGLPSDYRRAQTQKIKVKSDADLIKTHIDHKKETLIDLKNLAESQFSARHSSLLQEGNSSRIKSLNNGAPILETAIPNESSIAGSVATAAGIITGIGNAVNTVANMFQSDVIITPVDVNLSNKTLMTAIKRGVVESRCVVMTPEFTSNSYDPFQAEQRQMKFAMLELRRAATNLLATVGGQVQSELAGSNEVERKEILAKFAKLKLDTKKIVNESEVEAKSFWNGLYVNQVVQIVDKATNKTTDVVLPSLIEDINVSDAALSGGPKHFIGAKIVTSAATHIHSKGLFRSDRLHYTGSVVVEYEVVDQFGITQLSGLYDASMADLVRDKDGFTPTFGIVDNPQYLRSNPIGMQGGLTYRNPEPNSVYRYESK